MSGLPHLPVPEILIKLAELGPSSPLVTLSFTNGTAMRGWVVAATDPRGAGVMQLAENSGARGEGAGFFDPRQVVSIVVTDARALRSDAGVDEAPQTERHREAAEPPAIHRESVGADTSEAPERLDLARAATGLGERFAAKLGSPFTVIFAWRGIDTSSTRQMISARALLTLVEAELTALLTDVNARRALAAKTRGLEIANGELRSVQLIRDVLRVTEPLSEGDEMRFDTVTLRAALRRAL